MMDAKKIGRRIKAAREAKKLTQEQLTVFNCQLFAPSTQHIIYSKSYRTIL